MLVGGGFRRAVTGVAWRGCRGLLRVSRTALAGSLLWVLSLGLSGPYVAGLHLSRRVDLAGPTQTSLRDWLGYSPALFRGLESPRGACVILILAFYPYVYLLARRHLPLAGWRHSRPPQPGVGAGLLFFALSATDRPPGTVAGWRWP